MKTWQAYLQECHPELYKACAEDSRFQTELENLSYRLMYIETSRSKHLTNKEESEYNEEIIYSGKVVKDYLKTNGYKLPDTLRILITQVSRISGLNFRRRSELVADIDEELSVLVDKHVIDLYSIHSRIKREDLRIDLKIEIKDIRYIFHYYVVERKRMCHIQNFNCEISKINKKLLA